MNTFRVKIVSLLLLASVHQASGQSVSGTINASYKVTAINVATNHLTLNSTAGISPGTWVMIIQMKGATVNNSASASFGDITAINQAGNYEINNICAVNAGNQVFLQYQLLKSYNATGFVQLVTIPRYRSVIVADTLRSSAWNAVTGTGGVAALWATDTIFLNSAVDVSGKGFSGGAFTNFPTPTYDCSWTTDIASYFLSITPSPNNFYHGGRKGESISDYIPSAEYARGKQANGGGGGNNHNTGGAGGSNYGSGGNGGRRTNEGAFLCHGPNGGIGGLSLSGNGYTVANNRIFMGGGGGGGHQNNGRGTPGANGGGIILLISNVIVSSNTQLKANGAQPYNAGCIDPLQAEGDGGGGGGAGGSIIVNANKIDGNLSVQANGGRGSNSSNRVSDCTGPGGGGGAGVIWLKGASIPVNIATSVTGGANGTVSTGCYTAACIGLANSATTGTNGLTSTGYVIPMSSVALCYALSIPELKSFEATLSGNGVYLSWQFHDAGRIAKVEVEKTVDHVRYETVSKIKSEIRKEMTFADLHKPRVITFYRLKVFRKDNTFSYSNQLSVNAILESVYTLLQVYPNPSIDQLNISYHTQQSGSVAFTILNAAGVEVLRISFKSKKGYNLVNIPVSALLSGMYILLADLNGKKQIRKFIRN